MQAALYLIAAVAVAAVTARAALWIADNKPPTARWLWTTRAVVLSGLAAMTVLLTKALGG